MCPNLTNLHIKVKTTTTVNKHWFNQMLHSTYKGPKMCSYWEASRSACTAHPLHRCSLLRRKSMGAQNTRTYWAADWVATEVTYYHSLTAFEFVNRKNPGEAFLFSIYIFLPPIFASWTPSDVLCVAVIAVKAAGVQKILTSAPAWTTDFHCRNSTQGPRRRLAD